MTDADIFPWEKKDLSINHGVRLCTRSIFTEHVVKSVNELERKCSSIEWEKRERLSLTACNVQTCDIDSNEHKIHHSQEDFQTSYISELLFPIIKLIVWCENLTNIILIMMMKYNNSFGFHDKQIGFMFHYCVHTNNQVYMPTHSQDHLVFWKFLSKASLAEQPS